MGEGVKLTQEERDGILVVHLAGRLDAVNSPNLRSCLDVAHARIYSKLPLEVWIETLGHERHDEWRGDCLLLANRQGHVQIRRCSYVPRNEFVPGYVPHRVKDTRISDAATNQNLFDHFLSFLLPRISCLAWSETRHRECSH